MPFTFKLSRRLAAIPAAMLAATLVVVACEFQRATEPTPGVKRVELLPVAVALQPDQTVTFTAVAFNQADDTIDVAVTWSATGGSVTPMANSGSRHVGQYRSAVCGQFKVVAAAQPAGKADTANATVTCVVPPPVPVASVGVTPASASVDEGKTAQLTATPKDAAGNVLSGRVVTWTSSNTAAATVSASGLVTGKVAGSATITATSEGHNGTSAITVTPPPPPPPPGSGISPVLLTSGNSPVNQNVCTTAPISSSAGSLVTVAVLGHSSSTAPASPVVSGGGMSAWDEVATIVGDVIASPHKRLTIYRAASSAPGSGAIAITFSGAVSNCQWIVSQWSGVDVTGLNGASAIVQTGSSSGDAVSGLTVTLGPLAHPNNAAYGVFGVSSDAPAVTPGAGFTELDEQPSGESPPSDLQAQWGMSDNTVDATWVALHGVALAFELKAADTGPVAAVDAVEVTPASAAVDEGKTVQLTATPKDAAGNVLSGRVVTWTSNNTATATVGGTGLVTGKAAGSATITATSEGHNGTSAITVVRVPVASVSVAPASASVQVGSTVLLTATPKDASGTPLSGRTISWVSGNAAVATVNGSGLVSGVAESVVTITATSEGWSGSSAITVLAAPPPGSGVVLVGAGDIANCGTTTDEATALLLDAIPGTVFTAGDNVYTSGTTTEFTQCYEPTWGRHKARTRPAPGNHDYNTSGAAPYYAYFGANAGPAGRGYYSYDLGDWHIISLNSEVSSSAGSAQDQWLRTDLAANSKQCTLAYWHKPLFSSGDHGSLSGTKALWAALYEYNAELVVVGHDHNYERFAPQTADGVVDPARGLREFVVGTGGTGLRSMGTPIANSEVQNSNTHGVMKFTLRSDGYDWEFIPIAGKTFTDSGSGSCH